MKHMFFMIVMFFYSPAMAQDGFTYPQSRGFPGEGHAENHKYYQDLTNRRNGSCCNGQDCRTTRARWNNEAQLWEVMVNGRWQLVADELTILDDDWLEKIGHPRWDNQAHVCASLAPGDGNKFIYCVILPESGN